MNDLIATIQNPESIAMFIKLLMDKKKTVTLNLYEQHMLELLCLALGETIKPETHSYEYSGDALIKIDY